MQYSWYSFPFYLCIVQATDESFIQDSIEETIMGIYIWKHRDASEKPEDTGIVFESHIVLQDLDNVPLAAAMLFGLIYVLNLNYPAELKYTFEVLQKVVMELEGNALSKKAQALKNLSVNWLSRLSSLFAGATVCIISSTASSCLIY